MCSSGQTQKLVTFFSVKLIDLYISQGLCLQTKLFSNPDIPELPSLIGTGVAGMGMENEGNQEHQLNIPRLNSLQDRSLSPNFLALWKTRVG